MGYTNETAFEYYGDERVGYLTTTERKWQNKVRGWAKLYPDKVKVKVEPDKNDGCMCAEVPRSWFKISPPRKIELTEEQKEERRQRMLRVRTAKATKGETKSAK